MEFDKGYIKGIVLIIISNVGIVFTVFAYFDGKEQRLSQRISSAIELLPKCNFESAKEQQIGTILLQAKKSIDIDMNYDAAFASFQSVLGDMYACKPLLQANEYLMVITMLILMMLFGIMIIVNHYRELHKSV